MEILALFAVTGGMYVGGNKDRSTGMEEAELNR